MAIVFDAQGNLVDTEGDINFFNTGTEQVFPTQDVTQYMVETNTPFYKPDTGINTLRFVDNNSISLQPEYLMPNTNKVPQLPANRLEGLPNLDLQSLPANMGVANEKDVEQVNSLAGQNNSTGIMDLIMSIAVPGFNLLRNMGQGIQGLNQRVRNTDFAKSSSLADYFDARSYGGRDARDRAASQNMREARAIQKQMDMRPSATLTNQDKGRGNRPGGATYEAPSKPSRASSYRDSSSFGKSFHGG